MQNPFTGIHLEDVQAAITDIEAYKNRFDALVKEMHNAKIDGVDVGEFSALLDDIWGDTMGAYVSLANDAIEDATPYRDGNAEHRLTHAEMGLGR